MFHPRFLILLFALPLYSFAKSGTLIEGQIKDPKGISIPYATVMLLQAKDSSLVKGDITDMQGHFSFDDIVPGNYFLNTSVVGFKKYYSSLLTISASSNSINETIQLQESEKNLKEVKVLGKKPMIEIKADKTVFNVESSINATGSNALELLKKSPGVRVDKDDNIEMRGKNNVKIYIDGKPSYLGNKDLADYLKSMQSSDIESIELITNPSAKYEAEGNAGIINIRLKKNKKFGTNGTANAGIGHGIYTKYNAGINLNHRNKKVNVFGAYSYNGGKNFNDQNLYRIQNDVIYDFKAENTHNEQSNFAKAGFDYYINSKSVLGILASANYTSTVFSSKSLTQIGPYSTDYTQFLEASNRIDGHRGSASVNMNYKFEDSMGTSFNMDADYAMFQSRGKSYQPNTYRDIQTLALLSQTIFRNQTPTDIRLSSLKADYERNFLKGKLGLGVKSAYVKTDNDFKFYDVIGNIDTLNLNQSNHFVYTENVNAVYVNYNRQFNEKMSTQLGLRMEQTNSKGMLSSAFSQKDDTVSRHYLDFFPSAGFTYTLDAKNTLGLTYSRRIDRPSYQDLNPFENKLDELTYEKGNAFLRPQYTQSIDLTHTYMQYVTTTLNYSHTRDMFMPATDTTELKRTYVTQKNFASMDLAGINISFPIPAKSWWMIFANINANYNVLQANFEGRNLKNKYVTYMVYMDNTITLPREYAFNVSGWFAGPSYWGGTFKTNKMGSLDVGLQKQFLDKKLTVKASLSDVFLTSRWYATSNFSGLYIKGNGNGESRQLNLNLSYRFGNNQVDKQRERKSGVDSERNRIKGK